MAFVRNSEVQGMRFPRPPVSMKILGFAAPMRSKASVMAFAWGRKSEPNKTNGWNPKPWRLWKMLFPFPSDEFFRFQPFVFFFFWGGYGTVPKYGGWLVWVDDGGMEFLSPCGEQEWFIQQTFWCRNWLSKTLGESSDHNKISPIMTNGVIV